MLNPKQREAVEHPGHVSVLAIPGSGKTTLCITKIQRILETDRGATVLAVVFNTDAANEIVKRANDKGLDTSRIIAGTYHALALSQIKRNTASLKLATQDRTYSIARQALRDVDLDWNESEALQWIDFHKSSLERIKDPNAYNTAYANDASYALFRIYERELERRGLSDFTDILVKAVSDVASGSGEVLQATHIIADEFQDIDPLQLAWLEQHVNGNNAILTAVGDDDQTIYSFRAALGYRAFKHLEDVLQPTTIALSDNYRTRKEILDKAGKLIANNHERVPKLLEAQKGEGGLFQLHEYLNNDAELEGILEYASIAPEGKAILARNNARLKVLERYFKEQGFDQFTRTGAESYYTLPLPSALISALKLLYAMTSDNLEDLLDKLYLPDEDIRTILTAVRTNTSLMCLDQRSTSTIKSIQSHIKRYSTQLKTNNVGQINEVIISTKNLIEQLFPFQLFTGYAYDTVHLENACNSLCRMKTSWPIRLRMIEENNRPIKGVVLSTFHGSKGLEFDSVWIAGASERSTPDKGNLEEERRLFYVAMTRAKDSLHISYTKSPCQFIDEVLMEAQNEQPA
ncbi:MAG: hypothetical protein C9356_12235 [Oleiphilus sp.]|nr:MAG: hypothetical protein C9356_12235 [Oleiphilus sp.]